MEVNIQIKSILGTVLFEFSKENNTIKDTLIEAVKQDADLGGAYLRGAYLVGANLSDADLRGANLSDAGKLSSVNDILIVGPLGSRSAYTQIYRTDKGIFVKCGCFFGTIDEFATKVKETHGDNEHSKAYTRLVAYAKEHFEVNNNPNQ